MNATPPTQQLLPRRCSRRNQLIHRPVAPARRHAALAFVATLVATLAVAGCNFPADQPPSEPPLTGYVEGEYVYVAAPLAGRLDELSVHRGQQVAAADPLFTLDAAPEQMARDEAERLLAEARATWEDLQKGRRPSEIQSLEAQLKQAQAALTNSAAQFERQQKLIESRATSAQAYDAAQSQHEQNQQRVAQLSAELETARLGARPDQIAAAEARVRAMETELDRATWNFEQKRQATPTAALVFETLFRPGEWVPAGRPVVVLLPPGNIKVRAFVPETQIASVQVGQTAHVTVDGIAERFTGQVSYVAPRAEFSPPVIYSQQARAKLVFMIEISFPPQLAARLHPGQPVDVYWDAAAPPPLGD